MSVISAINTVLEYYRVPSLRLAYQYSHWKSCERCCGGARAGSFYRPSARRLVDLAVVAVPNLVPLVLATWNFNVLAAYCFDSIRTDT